MTAYKNKNSQWRAILLGWELGLIESGLQYNSSHSLRNEEKKKGISVTDLLLDYETFPVAEKRTQQYRKKVICKLKYQEINQDTACKNTVHWFTMSHLS